MIRRLDEVRSEVLGKLIEGVKFTDGIEVKEIDQEAA